MTEIGKQYRFKSMGTFMLKEYTGQTVTILRHAPLPEFGIEFGGMFMAEFEDGQVNAVFGDELEELWTN